MTTNGILLTGAAGNLGKVLRKALTLDCNILRLSSRSLRGPAGPKEEIVPCDLADAAAVDRLLERVDAVVHMGGQSVEAPWDVILQANVIGAINLWEAARKAGVDRRGRRTPPEG